MLPYNAVPERAHSQEVNGRRTRMFNPGYSGNITHTAVLEAADRAVRQIKYVTRPRTAVVVTGKSGISIGYAALVLHSFPLVVVRKDSELAHGAMIEGTAGEYDSYFILDDFVESGDTVRRVVQALHGMECLGVFQYLATTGHYWRGGWLDIYPGKKVPVYCG